MIKETVYQEVIAVINIYVLNIRVPKYIKQLLIDLKGEMDSNIILVGDFNILLTSMDRSSRKKVNKEIVALNETLEQMGLIDLYRTFHPKSEYTFFSSACGTFSRIDHMLEHKKVKKFKKIEIVSNIFSNHNGMKLEINYKKKAGKIANMWSLNNMLVNNYWVKKEIKGEVKKYLKTNENKNMTYPNLWDVAKVVLRRKFIAIQDYLKKQEKSQVNDLNLHLKNKKSRINEAQCQ